jgi:hypothetical protein
MKAVKGMVQLAGTTYRIVRLEAHRYEVIRILDDSPVGSFRLAGRLEVTPGSLDADEVREIARMAIRNAKTSWVGPLMPARSQLAVVEPAIA